MSSTRTGQNLDPQPLPSADARTILRAKTVATYARDHLFERSAVESGRSILTAALDRGMGEANFSQVRQEFDRRAQSGEFRTVQHGPKHEGQQYTTAETLRMERETIGHMKDGNQRAFGDLMMVDGRARIDVVERQNVLMREHS